MRTIKTAMDAMEEIKLALDNSYHISTVGLTGEIRILSRKLNSTKEDIIINTVTVNAGQIQEGLFNVNVHMPNLKGQPSENPTMVDNTQPDLTRMIEIGNAAIDTLNEVWQYDSHFSIDNAGEPIRDDKEWFLNILVRYYALRTDN